MILEAGEEMVKSLKIMFNRILKEQSIPRQWTEMTIKSIHKKEMLMENRRRLFLTSIISKVFERVLDEITQGDMWNSMNINAVEEREEEQLTIK